MDASSDYSSARKRTVTTYGKFAKRRAVPSSNVSASAYDFPADDDELSTAPRNTTSSSSDPSRRPSPSIPASTVPGQARVQAHPKALGTSLVRKRKLQQVSPAKPSTQIAPAKPARTLPQTSASNGANFRARRVLSAQSSDSSELDQQQSKHFTASPPRTPTPPRASQANKRRTIAHEVPFSPNTMQAWDKLGRDASPDQEVQTLRHQIPVRLADDALNVPPAQPSAASGTKLPTSLPASTAAAMSKTAPVKRQRKRLIDTLAEQSTGAEDEEHNSDDTDEKDVMPGMRPQLSSNSSFSSSSQNTGAPPATPLAKPKATPASQVRTFARSTSALKFQYGQQNKILEEEVDLFDSLAMPSESSAPLKGRRLELGNHKKKASASLGLDDDDLDTDSPKRMIRNIHELRQAGADSRDADEMADLSYQIGTAGPAVSSRRTALIQVAEKLHDKSFVRKYRAHGLEQTIFRGVEHEEDTIAACLLASILIIVLAKERSAHTMQVLHDEKPVAMLVRLFATRQTLKDVVRDRKSNLSKRNQTAILDIQKTITQPAVWKSTSPLRISPCTLGLKALRYLVAPGEDLASHASMLPASVTEALFSIVESTVDEVKTSEDPVEVDTTDLELAVSILHDHAAYLSTVAEDDSQWATAHLPVVADLFGVTMGRPNKTLEKSVLKLTINMVNHNLAAPDIFVSRGLVQPLAVSLCENFGKALELVIGDQPTEGLLDSLVLELGILINFCEHSPLARKTTFECGFGDQAPIDQIIRLFLDNRRKTSEADSVEKSHLNVVFGYLTILLGYLALYQPVREKFRRSHPGKNMEPLLESIREFMFYHKKMESLAGGEDEDEAPKNAEWQSLQKLAYSIEDEARMD
ncbi:wings apart-like protein regulation of heterochromatin-domain-containing protein [Microdochium trichocladiopsis]|uniref:Wings apart-like protein regulation of heterochromatin-domain-containing protein n=1 Tax=Microdochium trichocladiopsis TaxID=1682393 RepID=A0A9P8Y6H7_9PEZI|nr:wings apart-like protein regulation of heterochromatin-domain-containing protein [Microdochium trichocladiopsis]KAH7033015.1 wings apart-like protein regulation of heterochromatin-domain-containing protein [Microdochium trichocladiopsis]